MNSFFFGIYQRIYLLIYFVICFRLLYGIPSDTYKYAEAAFIIFLALSTVIKATKNVKISFIQISTILLSLTTLIAPSIMALITYGQNIFTGMAAKRDALLLFQLVENKKYRFNIIKTILNFNIMLLFIFIIVSLIFNPGNFVEIYGIDNEYVSYFIDYRAAREEYRFKFSFIPSVFCILFSERIKSTNLRVFVVFASIYWVMFQYGGRILIVALIITYLFNNLKFNFKSAARIFLLGTSILLLMSQNDKIVNGFVQIYDIKEAFFVTNVNNNDVSTLSRIQQFREVFSDINLKTLIVGNGVLSQHYNGGYEELYGRFHPSDLGILGVIFQYGIFYVIVVLYFFKNLIKSSSRPFKDLYLFFMIFSLGSGFIFFHPVVLIAIRILESSDVNNEFKP